MDMAGICAKDVEHPPSTVVSSVVDVMGCKSENTQVTVGV